MATVYAIGATALTGGTPDCLDAAYVSASGEHPGIADGYVAFVAVAGDAMYHYIADADSGAEADGVSVIAPLYLSPGVDYDGDLRWVLHQCYPFKARGSATGDIVRWNADTGAWESCSEPFQFKQINLTPLETAMEDVEGGMFYKSTDKQIYVCTEGE